jgi:hypothetical protein
MESLILTKLVFCMEKIIELLKINKVNKVL